MKIMLVLLFNGSQTLKTGCVWVYSLKEPSFNPRDNFFCHQLLYHFAYWIITLPFLELAVLILLFVVFLCFQDVANYPV